MIQLFVKEGKVVSTDVPIPEIEKGSVLIRFCTAVFLLALRFQH